MEKERERERERAIDRSIDRSIDRERIEYVRGLQGDGGRVAEEQSHKLP